VDGHALVKAQQSVVTWFSNSVEPTEMVILDVINELITLDALLSINANIYKILH
jgi:hypothetical protein